MGMRILIVEDNKLIRTGLVALFSRKGHIPITRIDTTGVESLLEICPQDLVLTDNNLGFGKESGLALARRLHEKGVNVVLLSADPQAVHAAIIDGIKALTKPATYDEIIKAAGGEDGVKSGDNSSRAAADA